ncbi:hypothetical protein WN944_008669 [Citrus x changshan-huyou]|uniref:Uncharacterized protein n=1 Tax=Citrus x changshan-huyou TaxID=2935761 RepID=A0AAP0QW43_9ROSI
MKKADPGIDFQCPDASRHGGTSLRLSTTHWHRCSVDRASPSPKLLPSSVNSISPRKAQPSRHRALHRLVIFSAAATTRRHQMFLFSCNFTNTATTHDHEELEEGEYEEDELEVDEDEEEENGSVHDDGEGEREADTENYEAENDLQHRELQV